LAHFGPAREAAAYLAGYLVGLVMLLCWPGRPEAPQEGVFLLGVGVLFGVFAVIAGGVASTGDWRTELLEFVTMTGPPGPKRRRRERLVTIPAFFVTLLITQALLARPDGGLLAFAAIGPVILVDLLLRRWIQSRRPAEGRDAVRRSA
jgi:hypothetical protein